MAPRQNSRADFRVFSQARGEFVFALSGVIDMEQVVRRIHRADEASVIETALNIKNDTIRHLYRTWKEQSGAAGRSVQVIDVTGASRKFGHTRIGGRAYAVGGFTAQVGSVYDAGNFQRGINHFVLLEGGFTLRSGQFKKGGHSLALASLGHAGALPKSWVRHYNSGVR